MTKFYKKNYPRPQFVRESFFDLNGTWRFAFDHECIGVKANWRNGIAATQEIVVPFSYESKLSGIGLEEHCPCVWYEREIIFPNVGEQRVLLYFEGCDYLTELWVNGIFAGEHRGGYSRFCFDITGLLTEAGEAKLVLCARDWPDTAQLRGKQRWLPSNYGCWYTQTTGIWKSVWAECVPTQRLEHVKITPQYDLGEVDFLFEMALPVASDDLLEMETIITYGNQAIYQGRDRIFSNRIKKTVSLASESVKWKIETWSLEHPNLYDVEFRLFENGKMTDRVGSYFGVRKISAETGRVTINNADIYLRMILDQGYWKDSLLTAPNEDAIVADLRAVLEYGYNGVRKHQKIEDERFYYWADVLGLLVWCEAPSNYECSDRAIENFVSEWIAIVRQHHNHPSIITWVPFNESWGIQKIYTDKHQQSFSEAVYHLTKAFDPTRPVITNDGWEHTISDILTLHDYSATGDMITANWAHKDAALASRESFNGERYAFAQGYSYRGQPVIISEFGGIALASDDGWGYGDAVSGQDEFLERLAGQLGAIRALDFVCGFCYTQLNDTQQEVNGLMSMERKDKIPKEVVRKLIEKK